jgi:hypothetical protein
MLTLTGSGFGNAGGQSERRPGHDIYSWRAGGADSSFRVDDVLHGPAPLLLGRQRDYSRDGNLAYFSSVPAVGYRGNAISLHSFL